MYNLQHFYSIWKWKIFNYFLEVFKFKMQAGASAYMNFIESFFTLRIIKNKSSVFENVLDDWIPTIDGTYKAFLGFGQAKFAYVGSILHWSHDCYSDCYNFYVLSKNSFCYGWMCVCVWEREREWGRER